jgi:hypothetical protein
MSIQVLYFWILNLYLENQATVRSQWKDYSLLVVNEIIMAALQMVEFHSVPAHTIKPQRKGG